MHSDDDESVLKAAFSELHRREHADAPPFDAMRHRAMSGAGGQQRFRRYVAARLMLWGAPAAACVVAVLLWVSGRFSNPVRVDARPTSSTQRVEQLLNTIEQELDVHEAISSASYPTDALLTQTDTVPPQ